MDRIYNANQVLIRANDDLRSLLSLVSYIEDHSEDNKQQEALAVVRRTLSPVIVDLQETIETIDVAICDLNNDEDEKEAL